MNEDDSVVGKRVKKLPLDSNSIGFLLNNPTDFVIRQGFPDDVKFIREWRCHEEETTYLLYHSLEWERVEDPEEIPEVDLDVHELYCRKCGSEMMWDADKKEQYCPNDRCGGFL